MTTKPPAPAPTPTPAPAPTPASATGPRPRLSGAERRRIVDEALKARDEEAYFADGLDDAIIGIGSQHNTVFVVYDTARVLEGLYREGMSLGAAIKHFEFNIRGAYVGPHTPVFVEPVDDLDAELDGITSDAGEEEPSAAIEPGAPEGAGER